MELEGVLWIRLFRCGGPVVDVFARGDEFLSSIKSGTLLTS